jgi:WD40 repeat protein
MSSRSAADLPKPSGPQGSALTMPEELSGLTDLLEAVGFPQQESGEDPLLGTAFDGVTLLRMIAEGGMGRVYEAEQEKPCRRVAVKLVRPGVTSPSLLKRFAYEAEILGRLKHPGIAQIHAVGVLQYHDTPLPYFIMEYITGAKTLVQYAEVNGLTVRQRLSLFAEVCAAVSHGHQRGIIHRDLKPSNILVDDAGQVKVIDFGVARATDSDITMTTMHSDVGQLIGTLQYMSPEQFDARPDGIDIRSDVYALGVVLYQLLAGRLPYDIRKKAFLEVMRTVKEDEPDSLLSHQPTLGRDVAVITEKCLRKEPDSRYESASELAADIGRYLRGDSILAAPASFWNGLLRLARRHKAAAAAVAGILASLAVALVAISVFAIRTERAMRLAREAQAAEIQQRTAAEAAKRQAEAGEAEARRRLYATRAMVASRYMNGYRRDLSEEFWNAAKGIFRETGGEETSFPPEIPLIGASFNDSVGVFSGHTASIRALAVSAANGMFVTSSQDNTIRVWNVKIQRPVATFRTAAAVVQLAIHPVATEVAGVTAVGELVLIDWETNKSIQLTSSEKSRVSCVAFSPDGKWLSVGTEDGQICLWDAVSKTQQVQLSGHRDRVSCLRFSPDSTLLGSGSWDKTARIWIADTSRQVAELATGAKIGDIVFRSDGQRLLVGSFDWKARLWDFKADKISEMDSGSSVSQVAFVAADKRLVTLSRGGHLRLWDADSGSILKPLGDPQGHVNRIAVSPDGSVIAAGSHDGSLGLWDGKSGDQIGMMEGSHSGVTEVSFLANDEVLTAGYAPEVRRWKFTHAGEFGRLAYRPRSPFSDCCFIPGTAWLATACRRNGLAIWDSEAGSYLGGLPHRLRFTKVTVSRDGSQLAAAGIDCSLRVWDLVAGVVKADCYGHDNEVSAISFSADGRLLASASFDASVRVWEPDTGQLLTQIDTGLQRVLSVTFRPDGKFLALGGHSAVTKPRKTLQIRSLPTGELVREVGNTVPVLALAFNVRGDRLAYSTTTGRIIILDPQSGDQICSLFGHTAQITSLAFTADGARLLSASEDGSARLWDVGTGDAVAEFRRHQGGVTAATMTPDARKVATASDDGTVRIWGQTGQEFLRNRNAAPAVRQMLQPLAETILSTEPASRRVELTAVKATLSANEWRELSNLVLLGAISNLKAANDLEPGAAK